MSVLKSNDDMYHYCTQDGTEINLLVRQNDHWLSVAEIKLINSPSLTKGTRQAVRGLGLEHLHVITPSTNV